MELIRPDFKPLTSNSQRASLLGKFDFTPAPIPGNKEHISLKGTWAKDNLVRISMPRLIGITGAPRSGLIECHKMCADALVFLFEEWAQNDLTDLIHTWDGMFAPRFIRGSITTLSNHAFGTAFDINAAWNPLGHTPAEEDVVGTVIPLVNIATKHRFYWGGFYSGRPDGMHFEYVPHGV